MGLVPAIGLIFLISTTGCAPLGKRFVARPKEGAAKPDSKNTAFQNVKLDTSIGAADLHPSKEPFRIGVSDGVEIEQLGVSNTRQECRVMPDGMLYYQAIPGLKVTGMTLPELKTKLQTSLLEFYRNPQVSIILRSISSQHIWVLGRVNASGLYPLTGPTTVLEAISRAGGLFTSRFSGTTEELADLRHSFLVRNGEFLPVDFYKLLREGDLSQNVYLHSGDYLYIPSALTNEVYVMGAVQSPKAVGFKDQITLVSAVAEAKGLLPAAYAQRAVIVRGSLVAPTVATVNFNRIITGKDPDVILQPRDIVWIPNSPWDRVETYTKMILNTFTRTVAANEGSHAASPTATNIKPYIPIGTTGQ